MNEFLMNEPNNVDKSYDQPNLKCMTNKSSKHIFDLISPYLDEILPLFSQYMGRPNKILKP